MVRIKQKVTLKKKSQQVGVADCSNQAEKDHTEQTESHKSNSGASKWLLIIIAVILIVAVVLCLRSCGGSSSEVAAAHEPESTSKVPNAVDNPSLTSEQPVEVSKEEEHVPQVSVTNSEQANEEAETSTSETQVSEVVSAEAKQEPAPSKPSEVKKTESPMPHSGDIEEMAWDVIRGLYGNGNVRKEKLGDNYTSIQNKVNELYRQGLVR